MKAIVSMLCALALVGGAVIGGAEAGGGNEAKSSSDSRASADRTKTLEGVVQSVSADSLVVKTEHGDTKTIDVSQLGQDVAQVAVVGQRVTIAGVQADGAFRARDITRTEGAASASPRTGNGDARPTSVDDCKDGGYLKYGFKNQGQCVSSVTPGKPRN